MSLNPLSAAVWQQRSDFKKLTRRFFDNLNFVEADTPVLVHWPSLEPHLDPYEVSIEAGRKAYLCSSPEFGLKKILGSGCTKVYELAHSFRSYEQGPWHSREFIMLEWYQVGLDLKGLMDQCANFLASIFPQLPQYRFSVEEWMQRQGFPNISPKFLKNILAEQGCDTLNMDDDEAFFRLFLPTESQLEKLGIVFLYNYPESQRSYATVRDHWAQRFEVYIHGIEVGNAFEEERQPERLLALLEGEQKKRRDLGKNPLGIDLDFVKALAKIPEPISGIAMGWDRLFALWAQQDSLRVSSPFLTSEF